MTMTVDLNPVETLLAIAEIATALAGFSGVVVVFGSRSQGSWQAGDRMRLGFLLEASLAAGGFALLTLLLLNTTGDEGLAWTAAGAIWALYKDLYQANDFTNGQKVDWHWGKTRFGSDIDHRMRLQARGDGSLNPFEQVYKSA